MVVGNALLLTGLGLAIGLVGTLVLTKSLTHVLEPLLFEVNPRDLQTLAIVPIVLTIVAVVATLIPARRATRIDPIQALRTE
jgi:ABC-type antimicrobial peptide transport system permease subunit